MSRRSITTLEQVCRLITDGAHQSPKSVEHGIPMGSVKDMSRYGIILETCRKISPDDYRKLVAQGCKPEINDILIAKDGNSCLETVCVHREEVDLVLLSSVAILRPNTEVILPDYLWYFLDSTETRNYLKQGFISGAAIPRVILKDFKRAEIPLPTMTVQKAIVSSLKPLDDLICNNNKRISTLEILIQLFYKEWFVNFNFPGHEKVKMVNSGHPDFGIIPDGWCVTKLGEIATIDWGDTTKTKSIYTETGYTAYSASGPDGRIAYFDFDRDGIVLSAIGANCGATWFATGKWSCIKNTIKFWATNSKVPESYLFYATYGNDFFPKRGAAQPFISKGDCELRPVLLPDSKCLKEFNEIAHPALTLIKNLRDQNLLLIKIRDLLLPKLISGEIDVSELSEIKPENLNAKKSDTASSERTRL